MFFEIRLAQMDKRARKCDSRQNVDLAKGWLQRQAWVQRIGGQQFG